MPLLIFNWNQATLDCPDRNLNLHSKKINFNPLNPAGRFSGLHKQGTKNPASRFSGICYGVSKTRSASKPAHVRLIITDLFTPESIRLHLGHKLKVQACLVFAQYVIYRWIFVLDARFCVENMAEILSVCEDTVYLMLWTM